MEIQIPFAGFYNSIHDSTLDQTIEMTFGDDQGHTLSRELFDAAFSACDWKNVHLDYAKKYTERFADMFGLSTLKFKMMCSPRYYNFETDRIICEIEETEWIKIWESLTYSQRQNAAKKWFTSYDGFIPHYRNDYTQWDIDPTTWDHNQLGCMFSAWLEAHEDYREDYEYSLLEDMNETAYQLISENIADERIWKIQNYLYERTQRKYKSDPVAKD